MPENEVKRCLVHSLSYWSHKTLESNMSHAGNQPQEALKPEAKTRTRPAQRLPTSKTCPHTVVDFTVAGLLGAVVFPLLL